jgi:hypothetical protein
MPKTRLVAVAIFCIISAGATRAPAGDVLTGNPLGWAPRRLLESLDPSVREARRAAVEAALRDFPGCGETLLLALLDGSSLAVIWSDPASAFGPLSPALAGETFNNRNYGMMAMARPAAGLERGEAVYEPLLAIYTSPLLLDLNGDGKPGVEGGRWEPHAGFDIEVARAAVFDVNGDGFEELTEWVDGTDGLLSESKAPRSGLDLFGTAGGWKDGFRKLAARDADRDGRIAGEELAGLFVWTDADRDAVAGEKEVVALEVLGVAEIVLPGDAAIGSFSLEGGGSGTVWDWWPTNALCRRRSASGDPAVPDSIALDPKPAALSSSLETALPLSGPGRVSREALVAAGIDWETATHAGLSPDGSFVLLADRGASDDQVRKGLASRLWAIRLSRGKVFARPILLPLAVLHQVVFAGPGTVISIGENGARAARVDLAEATGASLLDVVAGTPGFRAGDRAWRSGDSIYFTGGFRDADAFSGGGVIAGIGIGTTGPVIERRGDLDAMREAARALGDIVQEVLVDPALGFFIVRPEEGRFAVVAVQGGKVVEVDSSVQPGVLSASGARVLYLKSNLMLPVLPILAVKDLSSGEEFPLGSGEFLYPYLTGDGSVACAATIDWEAGRMTFFSSRVETGGGLEPFLSEARIGALRVSEDGSRYAYLGPEGLIVGHLPGGPERPFVRGNADGSTVPPENPASSIDLTDAISLLSFLFMGGAAPPCRDAADATDDGEIDISDPIRILDHLFLGRKMPAPWPAAGEDPTTDDLLCEE